MIIIIMPHCIKNTCASASFQNKPNWRLILSLGLIKQEADRNAPRTWTYQGNLQEVHTYTFV
jgi:hypothetical protein